MIYLRQWPGANCWFAFNICRRLKDSLWVFIRWIGEYSIHLIYFHLGCQFTFGQFEPRWHSHGFVHSGSIGWPRWESVEEEKKWKQKGGRRWFNHCLGRGYWIWQSGGIQLGQVNSSPKNENGPIFILDVIWIFNWLAPIDLEGLKGL